MHRRVQFPIKGTYYYSAELALRQDLINTETQLVFAAEPDNKYDQYAIQIWLPSNETQSIQESASVINGYVTKGYLLGYVPRVMSRSISKSLKNNQIRELAVVHHAQIGRRIEVDCLATIELNLLPYFYLIALAYLTRHMYFAKRIATKLFNRVVK